MRRALVCLAIAASPVSSAGGQDNVPPVIAKFKERDPRVAKAFDDAYGYVVFPTVGKGAIGSVARGARAGCTSGASGSDVPRSPR
jgi:hypothetical protein